MKKFVPLTPVGEYDRLSPLGGDLPPDLPITIPEPDLQGGVYRAPDPPEPKKPYNFVDLDLGIAYYRGLSFPIAQTSLKKLEKILQAAAIAHLKEPISRAES